MKNDNYFKRLDYTVEDISSSPFPCIVFQTESETMQFQPITDFLSTKTDETLARIFNFEKSDRERNCGLGTHFIQEVYTKRNSGFYLKITNGKPKEEPENFFIHFSLNAAHPVLFDQNYIEIASGSAARIILYFDTDETDNAEFYRNGLISIAAGAGTAVEIIKIQNLADSARYFETVRMDVAEKACVSVYDIHIGSKKTGASYSSYMSGSGSEVKIFPLYFADKDRRMDIEHNLIINGKKTDADITARGALKNEAHKVFRGNIFLNKGCSGSTGRFSDNSIMLDKTVKGTSIPTIFCDEDDVVGEHAASFVAIDKEKLFYIMSRGFDEASAKKLIIESAFRPVFDHIQDDAVRTALHTQFDKRLAAQNFNRQYTADEA